MKAFMASSRVWAAFGRIGGVVTVVKFKTAVYISFDFLHLVILRHFEQNKTNMFNGAEA